MDDLHEGRVSGVGVIRCDVPLEAPVGKIIQILCLCMILREERSGESVGVALLPTSGPDEYRRVGLIFFIQLSWFEVCAKGETTLD